MSILIFALVVLIVVAMLIYAVDFLKLVDPFNGLLKFVVVVIGVVLILGRAGLM